MSSQPIFTATLIGEGVQPLTRTQRLLASLPEHFRLISSRDDAEVAINCATTIPEQVGRNVRAIALVRPAPEQWAATKTWSSGRDLLILPLLRYAPALSAATTVALAADDPATLVNVVVEVPCESHLTNAIFEGLALASLVAEDAVLQVCARTRFCIVLEGKCPKSDADVRITARCGWRDFATVRTVSRSVRMDCLLDGENIAAATQVVRHDALGNTGNRLHFESGDRRCLRHLYDNLAGNSPMLDAQSALTLLGQTAALLSLS